VNDESVSNCSMLTEFEVDPDISVQFVDIPVHTLVYDVDQDSVHSLVNEFILKLAV